MVRDPRDNADWHRAQPPTADQVPYCPPHWWIIEETWQYCRKCGEGRPLNQVGSPVLEPETERETEMGGQEEESYTAE